MTIQWISCLHLRYFVRIFYVAVVDVECTCESYATRRDEIGSFGRVCFPEFFEAWNWMETLRWNNCKLRYGSGVYSKQKLCFWKMSLFAIYWEPISWISIENFQHSRVFYGIFMHYCTLVGNDYLEILSYGSKKMWDLMSAFAYSRSLFNFKSILKFEQYVGVTTEYTVEMEDIIVYLREVEGKEIKCCKCVLIRRWIIIICTVYVCKRCKNFLFLNIFWFWNRFNVF